jgi:CubicO group peptidase (beta-lactamase class C family)
MNDSKETNVISTSRGSLRQALVSTVAAIGLLAATACNVQQAPESFGAPDLSAASPEAVGLSSERLARLDDAMAGLIEQGQLAGMTIMLARGGRVVHSRQFGMRDLEASDPMPEDAVFRIYSMSKPITGVALMMLYEEGRFRLSDPVARYIPEFAELKVAAGEGPNGPLVEDADHPMTMRELLTHTAGFTYGLFSQSQVDSMYVEAGVLDRESSLRDMIEKLAEIPLRQQPGSMWHYSVANDVQGYLVEVLSGRPFDEFLEERLFGPLGMVDTGFWVPPEKAHRLAQVYRYDEGTRDLVPGEGFGQEGNPFLEEPRFLSGGGGLVSTTADYLRFSQMMLNGGELDGVRILSPTTVELMTRNHLPRHTPEMSPGVGSGLTFAVVLDPVAADGISEGEYSWGGAAGTWFWIDPVQDLTFVGMIQQFGEGRPDVRSLSRRLVYQAITEPALSLAQ